MSIHVHELKSLRMYSSNNKLYIPLNEKNNKKGSAIFLLTPEIKSSINLINNNMVINRNWFQSYYIEKSINTILTNENYIQKFINDSDSFIDRLIVEDKLPTKERNELPEKVFGIPDKRKYPLNDEEHVRAAIRMFNHVKPADEKTLAKNIIKKLNKFEITDIEVGKENRFYKYYHPVKEYTFEDIDAYSFSNKADISKELNECIRMYDIYKNDRFNFSTGNIVYLAKAYEKNSDELIGFLFASPHSIGSKDLNAIVILKEGSEDYSAAYSLVYNFRNYAMNTKGFNYDYADVFYDSEQEHVDRVMRKVALNYKTMLKGLSFTGLNNKSTNNSYFRLSLKKSKINIEEAYQMSTILDEAKMTDLGIQTKDTLMFFDDVFNEDSKSIQDSKLRKILYPERIKNQKDVMQIYSIIKASCKSILFTKLNYAAYKQANLYVDTSYYNKAFFENNTLTGIKGCELYYNLLSRLINVNTLSKEGYNLRTVFIPVLDWILTDSDDIFDSDENVNPVSIIVRMLRMNKLNKLQESFKDINFVFFGETGYFKMNFMEMEKKFLPRFISNIKTLINKSAIITDDIVKDSPDAIVTDIVDKLEKSQKINLYGLTGTKIADKSKFKDKETINSSDIKTKSTSDNGKETGSNDEKKDIIDNKKKKLVDNIVTAANNSSSTDEALEKLDNEAFIADLIKDISDEENTVKYTAARSARINTLNDKFKQSSIKGKTVSELINASEDIGDKAELKSSSVHINSINNDQWDNLQFINFNKEYNVDEDIMNILNFFSTRSVPVAVRDIKVENTSTSEDLIETWTVQCEDINGTRFSLKFDIPKFKNNRFMRLRGNDKTINGQLMNLPILKTEKDVCQITTNYNKIFFRIFGSTLGKSNIYSDRVIKALNKMEGNAIETRLGSNRIGSLKYDLPLDYIDFSMNYSTINYRAKGITFYFNQDEIREKYKDKIDYKFGLPVAYDAKNNKIIYSNTFHGEMFSKILWYNLYDCTEFKKAYDETKPSVRYSYSKASIMTTEIPVIVLISYCEGLTKSLSKASIEYRISETRSYDKNEEDIIKFNDCYLIYRIDYCSSLLMNGLKECPTDEYSIKEVDTKAMWTEFLDIFGGRIKADGIDNFYDLMFDPISIRTCEAYDIPSDFCSALIYASNLLADSKFNKHVDITGNRFRTNELIAGYTYKALSRSYAEYKTKLKKTGKGAMSIKQSAVIDAILTDNTSSDASTINDLCYAEAANTISFKGLSGMNSERSYSLDKRTYDESMNGILAMSTGFTSTVGENRQGTINMNIQGKRGYIKDTAGNKEIMNDVNTASMAEALVPMSTTHDDPFREAMSFTQRTKHGMRVACADPLLITNGADDAISKFTPDIFSFNAKQDGKILEKTNEHIVVRYKDGSVDYIDLRNKVYKNSDGGFYAAVKLVPVSNLGTTVKEGQVIAYDPLSYTENFGFDNNPTYNQGALVKVAIMTTDEGFEDSTATSQYVANALSSDIIVEIPVDLNKNTNVFNLVKVGQKIEEGEPLMIIQNPYEDADVNILLKNLVDDEDAVTSLGRIPIKSKNTGYIEGIEILRTVEISELSESLQKIVKAYEAEQTKIRKTIEKYDPEKAKEYVSDYKLSNTGRLKNLEEGVRINIHVKYKDDFGVGDKLIILGAQKGVSKEKFTPGNEPRSEYRKNEIIDVLVSMRSFDARMITAPLIHGACNKGVIELDRQIKEIMGIKCDNNIHHKEFE